MLLLHLGRQEIPNLKKVANISTQTHKTCIKDGDNIITELTRLKIGVQTLQVTLPISSLSACQRYLMIGGYDPVGRIYSLCHSDSL